MGLFSVEIFCIYRVLVSKPNPQHKENRPIITIRTEVSLLLEGAFNSVMIEFKKKKKL